MKLKQYPLTISFSLIIYSTLFSLPSLPQTREELFLFNQVRNTVYSLPNSQKILLVNGRYQHQNGTFRLNEKVALGDINYDGKTDAIVILTRSRQGIQRENYLAVLIANQGGELENIDTLSLDDQIQLETLMLQDKTVTLDFLSYAPSDSPCCPSRKKQLKYEFDTVSETLMPLSMEAENEPQDSLRINQPSRPSQNNENDNEFRIRL